MPSVGYVPRVGGQYITGRAGGFACRQHVSRPNRKFRFRPSRKFRFQTTRQSKTCHSLIPGLCSRMAAGPGQARAGVARRRGSLEGGPLCKTIPVEGMAGKCKQITIPVTRLKAELSTWLRHAHAPSTFLEYHGSGAFLQSRCRPFYFDRSEENRESDSIRRW